MRKQEKQKLKRKQEANPVGSTALPVMRIWSQNLNGYQRGEKFADIASHVRKQPVDILLMQEIHEIDERQDVVIGMLEHEFPLKIATVNLKTRKSVEQKYRERQITEIRRQKLPLDDEEWEIRHIDVSKSRANGGVVTLFDKCLQEQQIIGGHYSDPHNLFICTPVHLGEQKVMMINVYAPASKEGKRYQNFLNELTTQMERYKRMQYQFILMGDFNSILDERTDRYSSKTWNTSSHNKPDGGLQSWMQNFHLQDAYRHFHKEIVFTFVKNREDGEVVKSRIDHCLVSSQLLQRKLIVDCRIMEDPICSSDHFGIELLLAKTVKQQQVPSKVKPKVKSLHSKRLKTLGQKTKAELKQLMKYVELDPNFWGILDKARWNAWPPEDTEFIAAQECLREYTEYMHYNIYGPEIHQEMRGGIPIICNGTLKKLKRTKEHIISIERYLERNTYMNPENPSITPQECAIVRHKLQVAHLENSELLELLEKEVLDRHMYSEKVRQVVRAYTKKCKETRENMRKDQAEREVKRMMETKQVNPKQFYKAIRSKFSNKSLKAVKVVTPDGETCISTDPKEVLTATQSFWQQLYKTRFSPEEVSSAEKQTEEWMKSPKVLPEEAKMQLTGKITAQELDEVLKDMSGGKSPGMDGFAVDYLKTLRKAPRQKELLVRLFNVFFEKKQLPEEWKQSTVTLIYKDGDENDVSNYRPISLQSTLYKTYSGVLTKRLQSLIRENKLLSFSQSGWQFNKQTFDNIAGLITIFEDAKLKHKPVHVLYLDIKKAYDSVEFWAIAKALRYHGIPDEFVQVVESMFEGLNSQITTGLGETDKFEVTRGVRQGDVISPYLFLFFLDPLLQWIQQTGVGYRMENGAAASNFAFADDIALVSSSYDDLREMASKAERFFDYYKMEIGTAKSAYSEARTQQVNPTICFGGTPVMRLTPSQSYRYLGYHINLDLEWTTHFVEAKKKFKKRIAFVLMLNLSLTTKIDLINIIAIQGLAYYMSLVEFPTEELKDMEVYVKAQVKKRLDKQYSMNDGMLYASKEDGGRELWKVQDRQYTMLLNTLFHYVFNNSESCAYPLVMSKLESWMLQYRVPWNELFYPEHIPEGKRRKSKKLGSFLLLKNMMAACDYFGIRVYKKEGRANVTQPVTEHLWEDKTSEEVEQMFATHKTYWYPQGTWNTRVVWTDGSYNSKTNKAGFGVWYGEGHPFNHNGRVKGKQCISLGELQAIESALMNTPYGTAITIVTDRLNAIKLLKPDWAKEPISRLSKLDNKTTVLRIQEEIKSREEQGEPVFFEHIYSHIDEKLNDINWIRKVEAQRQLYGARRFAEWRKGNEYADLLATSALQLPDEPMTLFAPNSNTFEISFNSKDPLDGPLSPQLRAFMRPKHLDHMRKQHSFQELVPDVEVVEWKVSNDIFAKCWAEDHTLIDRIMVARADRLQDRKSLYERNIDFMTDNYIHKQKSQQKSQASCAETTDMARATSSTSSHGHVQVPAGTQVCPGQLPLPELPGNSALLSLATPLPRGLATEVLDENPVQNMSGNDDELYAVQALLMLANEVSQTSDMMGRDTSNSGTCMAEKRPRYTKLTATQVEYYKRMHADPYCERCKAKGINVVENRHHILVECPQNREYIMELLDEMLSYLNSVSLNPVHCIPNWFMSSQWNTVHCQEDLTPDLEGWMKCAGMCGYMPRAIMSWLVRLPLHGDYQAGQVARKLNHLVMTTTARILAARRQLHQAIKMDKCKDLKMQQKKRRDPRKYR